MAFAAFHVRRLKLRALHELRAEKRNVKYAAVPSSYSL